MIIYVRAKKDRDALSHVIQKYFNGSLDIRTFQGKRGKELEKEVLNLFNSERKDFIIVLLGKNEENLFNKEELSSATFKLDFVSKSKIRHTRQNILLRDLSNVIRRLILDVKYEDTYIFGKLSNFIDYKKINSSVFDVFLILYKEFIKILEKFGLNLDLGCLVLHLGDFDVIFSGKQKTAEIERSLNITGVKIRKIREVKERVDVNRIFRENKSYFEEKLKITVDKLKRICEKFDNIIVPWSGGKDSTAVLILAKKYLKNRSIIPIFLESGIDFEEVYEYLDYISKKLKIRYETVNFELKEIYEREKERIFKNRKCTSIKIQALYSFVENNFENFVILTGDRISESLSRFFREEFRYDGNIPIYSPIKYWSYFDIQYFLKVEDIPINKLYKYGFYRIGCKICPFLDPFEKEVLRMIKSS